MPQGTTHKTHTFFERLKKNLDWRWLLTLILGIGISVLILIFHPSFWQTPWGYSIFFLNLTITPVLFIFRNLATEKSWRENRWIVMPAVFVLLFWVNSTWGQVYLTVERQHSLQTYPPAGYHQALHAIYPRRMVYETDANPLVLLWWDCPVQITCADVPITVESDSANLQFALKSSAPVWKQSLDITLPADGSKQTILLRQIKFTDGQSAVLRVTNNGGFYSIGPISLEGAQISKIYNFWAGLLQTSSVVITIIVAIFAALKQLDEQKHKERKEKIDDLISEIQKYEYKRGEVKSFLGKVTAELRDWDEWWPEQQDECSSVFRKFVDTVITQSISEEHYSSETSLWTDSAIAIIQKFGYADQKALIERVTQQASGYSPKSPVSLFPPEPYPLQRRFARRSILLPEIDSWGIPAWEMRFAPFGADLDNPFRFIKESDFPMLAAVKFTFLKPRSAHQTYPFQNAWDLRAAYYQYCRSFDSVELRDWSRRTFFVPGLPEAIPAWENTINLEQYLLHNLASAWLRALANSPELTEKMGLLEVETLARLLAWHYGSTSAVQILSLPADAQIIRHLQGIKPESSLVTGEKTKWLALRPAETERTLYLCAQVSPTGKAYTLGISDFPKSLAQALEAVDVSVARFLLAGQATTGKAMKMTADALLLLLDERVRLSNQGVLRAFEGLFFPPPTQKELMSFISRANGSPGAILQMAHTLMERHLQNHPDNPDIDSNELLPVNP